MTHERSGIRLTFEAARASQRTLGRIITGIVMLLLLGCATPARKAAERQLRYAAARDLFEQTSKTYHIPSTDLQGADKMKLLDLAAAGYEKVLKKYPDEKFWCAQALRSLGNVRAAQGRLDEAVKIWVWVEKEYPQQDWEVLLAWKSSADQLWDAGRHDEAREFYRKIVGQFDTGEEPTAVIQIVESARLRLVGD
jgi:tetratricopeptide (TPR) repeat protein